MSVTINKDPDFEFNVNDWNYVELFWLGGRRLIEGFDQNSDDIVIPQLIDLEVDKQTETQDFLAKKAILSIENLFRKGIIGFDGYVIQAGVNRNEDVVEIPENTDKFWNQVRRKCLWLGDMFVGVDAPRSNGKIITKQDVIDQNLKPFWVQVDPRRVPFTEYDDNGNLTQIVIAEEIVVRTPFSKQQVDQKELFYLWWTDKNLEVWKDTGSGVQHEMTIEHNFGKVPFKKLKSPFDVVMICNKLREIINRKKISLGNTFKSGLGITAITGLSSHQDAKASPNKNLISLLGEHADIKTLGVDAGTMQENREDLIECMKEARRSLFLPTEESLNQSGVSKREDKNALYSSLTSWAKQCEEAENYLGSLAWEGYEAIYPQGASDFIIESEAELNEMIETGQANFEPPELIQSYKKKLTTIQNRELANEVDFESVPSLNKSVAETLQIVGKFMPKEQIAKILGVTPEMVEEAIDADAERQVRISNAIDTGGAGLEDPEDPAVEEDGPETD